MTAILASIPSPSSNGFHIGPLMFHFYGLCYVVAIAAAIFITRRLWRERGGDPDIVFETALWGVPAGIIGARLYHDVTSWNTVQHNWWGWIAVWQGGLGIWGGIIGGFLGGIIPLRRKHISIVQYMDAVAPGLLVAQAIGRIGNYFNQELFGGPTNLPWALQISPDHRPPGYGSFATFQPTFLYELIWNLALAGFLIWLYRKRTIRPPGLFALYVTGYSAFRIFEETLRVDPSHYILGQRLNFWVAIIVTVAGSIWYVYTQRAGGPGPGEGVAESTAAAREASARPRPGRASGQADPRPAAAAGVRASPQAGATGPAARQQAGEARQCRWRTPRRPLPRRRACPSKAPASKAPASKAPGSKPPASKAPAAKGSTPKSPGSGRATRAAGPSSRP